MDFFRTSICLFFVVIFFYSKSTEAQTDMTLRPKTYGVDVVNAVNTKIRLTNIFRDENRFIIRMAYVETKFGLDPITYPPDYFGGIWQVDNIPYTLTKIAAGGSVMDQYLVKVKQEFNIEWRNTTWQDLEMPLYSALALRLYMTIITDPIPDTIQKQAEYWKTHLRPDGNIDRFVTEVRTLEGENVCRGRMDLVIALDGSGSITGPDFLLAKTFVVDLISRFSPVTVRTGFIVYSDFSKITFPVTHNLTPAEVNSTVMEAIFPGGGTRTDFAINDAIQQLPRGNATHNSTVPRVLTVFTDGRSNAPSETIVSAANAYRQGIISYSIGIGILIDYKELVIIAGNNPNQVISSSSYDALTELPYRVNSETCTIPQRPPAKGSVGDSVAKSETRYFSYELPLEGITIKINVSIGNTQAFYSYTFPTPSSAMYDGIIEGVTFIPNLNSARNGVRFQTEDEDVAGELYISVQGLEELNDFEIVSDNGDSQSSTDSQSTSTSAYSDSTPVSESSESTPVSETSSDSSKVTDSNEQSTPSENPSSTDKPEITTAPPATTEEISTTPGSATQSAVVNMPVVIILTLCWGYFIHL